MAKLKGGQYLVSIYTSPVSSLATLVLEKQESNFQSLPRLLSWLFFVAQCASSLCSVLSCGLNRLLGKRIS